MIQVAVKNNVGVSYFNFQLPPGTLFVEDGKMGQSEMIETILMIAQI